jgi:hypothetical protein
MHVYPGLEALLLAVILLPEQSTLCFVFLCTRAFRSRVLQKRTGLGGSSDVMPSRTGRTRGNLHARHQFIWEIRNPRIIVARKRTCSTVATCNRETDEHLDR